ncbi:MAG: hydrogenase maturation protease [bacterium]
MATATDTLVIYLGNPIIKNDCIGIRIGRRLEEDLSNHTNISIREFVGSPLDLITHFAGYQRVILVDSIMTGSMEIGTVVLFKEDEILTHAGNYHSLHGINLPEALALSKRMGMDMPPHILLVGIEIGDAGEFGETLSEDLHGQLEGIYKNVRSVVSGFAQMEM